MYIAYVCRGIIAARLGTTAYIIVLEGERAYVLPLAALSLSASVSLPLPPSLSLSLCLSFPLPMDLNADERRRCASVKEGCRKEGKRMPQVEANDTR